MIQGALDRGLRPMVTLHHFTNPRWIAERGGWLNPEIVMLFERYVRKVVGTLEDLVDLWITINEPNVLSYASYLQGGWPPGEKSIKLVSKVNRNLVKAHAAAYHAIHEIRADCEVGIAHHYRGFRPANPGNILHCRQQPARDPAGKHLRRTGDGTGSICSGGPHTLGYAPGPGLPHQ